MQKKLLINIRAVEKKHSYGHSGIAMEREMLENNLGQAVKIFFEIKNDKEITNVIFFIQENEKLKLMKKF